MAADHKPKPTRTVMHVRMGKCPVLLELAEKWTRRWGCQLHCRPKRACLKVPFQV